MASCPECDAELEIDDDDLDEMGIGDPWDCDACGSRLRVALLDPLEFDSDDEEEDDEEKEKEKESDDLEEELEDEDDDDADGDWEE